MLYIYMCVMDIMNVLRTGMSMSISRIHIWLCYICITYNSIKIVNLITMTIYGNTGRPSSVAVYRAQVFGGFSGHGNSIHNINSSS